MVLCDSTVFDIICKKNPNSTRLQTSIDQTTQWTHDNDMKINTQKTHEMVISFQKEKPNPPPIMIDGENIDRVTVTKLVGPHIQDNLKWDTHIENIVKKVRSKLYFPQKIKRPGAPCEHLLHFYKSVIVPQLEYAAPAWVTSPSKEQRYALESIQKRAFRIILPVLDYTQALETTGFETLEKRRDNICRIFSKKMTLPGSILSDLLTKKQQTKHCLRRHKQLYLPKCKTSRFKSSFVP